MHPHLYSYCCSLTLCFNSQDMYTAFLFWSDHNNSQVKHAGYMALSAFLQQISEMLVQKSSRNNAGDKAVFRVCIACIGFLNKVWSIKLYYFHNDLTPH